MEPLTLSEALTSAGGITARDREFSTIRIYRDGVLYQIPLETFHNQPELGNRTLVNGDAIYVDTSYDLDRALDFYQQKIDVISLRSSARGTALSALQTEVGLQREALEERRKNFEARLKLDAENRDYVYLTGEVEKQSRVALPFGRQATLAGCVANFLVSSRAFDDAQVRPEVW